MTDTINKYIYAAVYMERLKQVDQQVAIGNYHEAMHRIGDNELYYSNESLAGLGVSFVSAVDFVIDAGREALTREAVWFFARTGRPMDAWTCLVQLAVSDVRAKEVPELQGIVGRTLAERDFKASPEENPQKLIESYTGDNRWFVKFAKTYTDTWKELQLETTLKNPIQP